MAFNLGGAISGGTSGATMGSALGVPGAIVGGIAGGALGGFMGSKKKATYDPYGLMTPEQKQLHQALGSYLPTALNPEQYGGQLSEGISPGELAAVGSSNRLGALSEQGYADLMNPDLNTYNKQFDEWMANPQMSMFRRNVLPGIQEAMPTFSTAMGAATQRGYQDVADQLAQQRYAGWQAAQDRRLSALGQAPGAMSQYAATAGIPRSITQAGLDRAYSDWANTQERRTKSIDQMMQFLGMPSGLYTPESEDTSILSGLGQAASAFTGIQSANRQDAFQNRLLDILGGSGNAARTGVYNPASYRGYNGGGPTTVPTPLNYKGSVTVPGVRNTTVGPYSIF